MKKCYICKKDKPLEEFSKQAKSKDGKSSYCKTCAREKQAAWRSENKEYRAEYKKQYEDENREECRARSRAWRAKNKDLTHQLGRDYYLAFPERAMLYESRKRAKRRNQPHSISHTDITIPKFCPVLGLKLERGKGRLTDASPTLDCIIPAGGYVLGNIAVISHRANRLKSDGTPAELRAVADWMDRQTSE